MTRALHAIRMPKRPLLWMGLLLALALTLAAPFWSPLRALDAQWLDTLARNRAQQRQGSDEIVLIDIDEQSLLGLSDALGKWPWRRAVYGGLIEWLNAQGARAIVFDIFFTEPDRIEPDQDIYFTEVLSAATNVYLPVLQLDADPRLSPLLTQYPRFHGLERGDNAAETARASLPYPIGDPKSWRLGSVNFVMDDDGIGRRYDVWRDIDGWRLSSLPALIARDLGWPLPNESRFLMDWLGKQPIFRSHSFSQIYPKMDKGELNDEWKGKIVLIGATASGLHDMRPTPMHAQYPGFHILATALDNLRTQAQLRPLATPLQLSLGVGLLLVLSAALRYVKNLMSLLRLVVLLSVMLLLASWYAMQHAQQVPVLSTLIAAVTLVMAGALQRYRDEAAARAQAMDMFGRFLDPRVVEQLAQDGLPKLAELAQQRTLTILFSDIRGFTSLSENQAPAEVLSLLNAYFEKQVAVIFRHAGTLDKFIGDAIMAFWNAPLDDPEHAAHAVHAALDMTDALDAFCRERNLTDFDIGIGVHTGPAVVGMLGSDQRLDYTAIGDTINLGSRLEGLTKGVARVLVSEATRQACLAGAQAADFDFRPCGTYKVKGRVEDVVVYEPSRRATALNSAQERRQHPS